MSDRCLSERELTRWWHPVASSEALDLLYQAMHAVLYRCTVVAIEMASLFGTFILSSFRLLLPWWPLGRYGVSSRPMAASSGFRSK
jgi:hypothetical protein